MSDSSHADTYQFITPNWPAPKNVRALSTTRHGGVSLPPYSGFNLGDHVGDSPLSVERNREYLNDYLPAAPLWLNQVHGIKVINASQYNGVCDGDGLYTSSVNKVCAIMTADCLPVLFCNHQGTQVAGAHAGWRGLLDGVLENTVSTFDHPTEVMAWLGPAIGPRAFEVGQEVKDAFCLKDVACNGCFEPSTNQGKWLADLFGLARLRLTQAGVKHIYGGDDCTYADDARFFSYRRDGITGRMASCIWLT